MGGVSSGLTLGGFLGCIPFTPFRFDAPEGIAVYAKTRDGWVQLGELDIKTNRKTVSSGKCCYNMGYCRHEGIDGLECESNGKTELVAIEPETPVDTKFSSLLDKWAKVLDGTPAPEFCKGYETIYVAYHEHYMEHVTVKKGDDTVYSNGPAALTLVGFTGMSFEIKNKRLANPRVADHSTTF